MSDITFKPAWRRDDPQFAADAIALWESLGAMPVGTDPADRVAEIVVCAYDGDRLAGLSTTILDVHRPTRRKFAFYRTLVSPDSRQQGLMHQLGAQAHAVLLAWALEHPDEGLAGLATVRQQKFLNDPRRGNPVSPGLGSILVGFTPGGEPIRLKWFQHIRV